MRGERFPQLYPPLQWIKSEMVKLPASRCDPRLGRIAGADEPRRPANARPGRQRGPYSRLALRRQPLGRPNALPLLVPFARALAMPAAIRSWMIERSNSANTPNIWKSAFPAGVLVSTPWRSRYRSTPAPCSSPPRRARSHRFGCARAEK